MANSQVSLKLLIDKSRNKVVFAEAGKDFVDFLFNLMSLPIGTVTRLLKKKSMVGSLGKLYGSIENLNNNYLQTEETKESLLIPKIPSSGFEGPLLLADDDAEPVSKELYKCQYSRYSACKGYATDNPETPCPTCGYAMNSVLQFVTIGGGAASSKGTHEGGRGFVRELVTFMVTDDLVVTPSAAISSITKVINEVGVQGLEQIEERVVYLGMSQGLMLLKESLQSDTVLTNVFLKSYPSGTKKSSYNKHWSKNSKPQSFTKEVYVDYQERV